MAALIDLPDACRLRANLAHIRRHIDDAAHRAGRRDGSEVRLLAATKYVATHQMPLLAHAGVRLVGENRAQDLLAKASLYEDLFEYHFIGALQSRKVRSILPHVTLIHSVASESALQQLARHRHLARPGLEILIEVNIAREPAKAGISPEQLPRYLDLAPLPVAGLSCMAPLTQDPERSRPWFAALRELAREHHLQTLSMGTSQDYPVAVEEHATIVRIGTNLYS
ncbi:MAG TPA: YggS family pyridoxal phosphate-dependent enzyme [Solirubrobacteraceae bacterium]|nr:YggS family pyridoxal phosphate-dependent enzyme [Solirubrobacteraceae bacterium]